MLVFLTQFPTNAQFDKNAFFETVIRWNQGSQYDKFENLARTYGGYQQHWAEGAKTLKIDDIPEKGIIASRFTKENEHGVWTTDFILNCEQHRITVRVALETTELTTDFSPSYYCPYFVKLIIGGGYAGQDGNLAIQQKPHLIGDNATHLLNDLMAGRGGYLIPSVVIMRKDERILLSDDADAIENLAFKLQGIAHIIEASGVDISSTPGNPFFDEATSESGGIFISFPHLNMPIKKFSLPAEDEEAIKFTIVKIIDEVHSYHMMRSGVDTWEDFQNEKLHLQNKLLLAKKETVEDDNRDLRELYNLIDAQLKKNEENSSELNRKVQKLTAENEGLRTKLKLMDINEVPILCSGREQDMYPGEIREIILEILTNFMKKNCRSGTRRFDIIKDLLKNNEYHHIPPQRRDRIKAAFKGYRTLDNTLRNELKELGFVITEDGKHYKMTYYSDNRYVVTIPKTASDGRRGGANIASEIDSRML